MDLELAGKCVLVTGASGGIGSATARALATEGAKVGLHYRRHRNTTESLRAEIGGGSVTVGADLRDEQAVAAMFDRLTAEFQRIDAVVVNAGVWESRPTAAHEMTMEQWRATLASNLDSAFLTCRGFLRHLAAVPRETASIVLVGSAASLFGEAGHVDYAASKAAMTYGLTLSLKNEIVRLATRGRVNCVCPGWTNTPMAAACTGDPQAVQQATATMALQKIAQPADVAASIVWLTSDRCAGHITGAIVPVTGGMEGRLLATGDCALPFKNPAG